MRTVSAFGRPGLLRVYTALLAIVLLISIDGCGYKPVSRYGRSLFGNKVYVSVKPSGIEPRNGIFIREEISRVFRDRFDIDVVLRRADADSAVTVTDYRFGYSSLSTDDNGYVTRYRVTTDIRFELETSRGKRTKKVHVSEDVGIKASSLTSSAAREAAMRYSIEKAMDEFIAYVAQEGYLR
jgi:hypothetical protein